MASDEKIKQMIHAIMDKRKSLGIPDWGQVPITDVIERLNRHPQQEESPKSACEDPKKQAE